ncbi:uncharacterized protein [Ptychodera flava]|uniref:uncharacterized protein isoform X1 n=1 Tax=Ptychodera flava TaxID=63121 RepID=UPI00396A0495
MKPTEEKQFGVSDDFVWTEHIQESNTSNPSQELMIRRLYILCCIAFAYNDRCSYPCHLMLCEIIDKYTASSRECIEILNSFGIITSKDTHQRHVAQVSEQKLDNRVQWKEDSFITVSVDNIDKLSSYSAVSSQQDCRSFHGTSVQGNESLPGTCKLNDSEYVPFYTSSLASSAGYRLQVIPVGTGNSSFYRALVAHFNHDLKVCDRDSVGLPSVSTRDLQSLENRLSEAVSKSIVSKCFDSIEHFEQLDEGTSNVLLNEGCEFLDFQHRFEHVQNEHQPVGSAEIMVASLTLNCIIKLFVKVNDYYVQISSYGDDYEHLHNGPVVNLLKEDDVYKLLVTEEWKSDTTSLITMERVRHGIFNEMPYLNCDPNTNNCNSNGLLWHFPRKQQGKDVSDNSQGRKRQARKIPKQKVDDFYFMNIDFEAGGKTVCNANDLSQANFVVSQTEREERDKLHKMLFSYILQKYTANETESTVKLPGIKAFMMNEEPQTPEQSSLYYIAVFDEPADSRGTMLKVLDYLHSLLQRWVAQYFYFLHAKEVHVVFDDPKRNGLSPKDIERLRRDKIQRSVGGEGKCDKIELGGSLPRNWQKFLTDRKQKRSLVSLLSDLFIIMGEKLPPGQSLTVAGGFDNDRRDHAYTVAGGKVSLAENYISNHEEADSRVWLHCERTLCTNVVIYSPDTDVYWVGLPLVNSNKEIYVHLKSKAYDNLYIHMNTLTSVISSDIQLQRIPEKDVMKILQVLYIVSGCDYVSYFRGLGKKAFLDAFCKNAEFIAGMETFTPGKMHETDGNLRDLGLLAFYRLIGSVYFYKHAVAFGHDNPKDLFLSLQNENISALAKHKAFLSHIRQKVWARIDIESGLMPSDEALQYHWYRCCWVSHLWSQANNNIVSLLPMNDWGWMDRDGMLDIVWDTDENLKCVEHFVSLLNQI